MSWHLEVIAIYILNMLVGRGESVASTSCSLGPLEPILILYPRLTPSPLRYLLLSLSFPFESKLSRGSQEPTNCFCCIHLGGNPAWTGLCTVNLMAHILSGRWWPELWSQLGPYQLMWLGPHPSLLPRSLVFSIILNTMPRPVWNGCRGNTAVFLERVCAPWVDKDGWWWAGGFLTLRWRGTSLPAG